VYLRVAERAGRTLPQLWASMRHQVADDCWEGKYVSAGCDLGAEGLILQRYGAPDGHITQHLNLHRPRKGRRTEGVGLRDRDMQLNTEQQTQRRGRA
jgi:hypothetical protein